MKPIRLAVMSIMLTMLLLPPVSSVSLAASQDDVLERIKALEMQIQQLKALKEQQQLSEDKEQQCLRPTGNAKFCKCVAESLPQDVSFEDYVHFLVKSKVELKYDVMSPESRKAVDASIAVREKCVEKGWFK